MASSLFQTKERTMPQTSANRFSPEQIQAAKSLLSKQGLSAEQLVRNICQQRGIDVDKFIENINI